MPHVPIIGREGIDTPDSPAKAQNEIQQSQPQFSVANPFVWEKDFK
jgi:hypothetical protein